MTLRVYMDIRSKRAKTIALLDSGATENFINISYTQKLNLPIQRLTQERRLFNVNGTPNKAGTLCRNNSDRPEHQSQHLDAALRSGL
jgi:hypothetical protein